VRPPLMALTRKEQLALERDIADLGLI
jgi:hypothetical protein